MALKLTPNVFVMSSTNGRLVAEPLVSILGKGKRIDVVPWYQAFEPGESFLETLRAATLRFDFGILIVTPDDTAKVRGIKKKQPRDNVIFELGLFYAALGSKRALPIIVTIDKDAPGLPTDLLGVTMTQWTVRRRTDVAGQIRTQAQALRDRILRLYKVPSYGLLPSTALAVGYFINFVQPVIQSLVSHREVGVEGKASRQHPFDPGAWKFSICIPPTLFEATKERWAEVADGLKLEEAAVKLPENTGALRRYPFRVSARVGEGSVQIYDTPTTLRTAYDTVRKLMKDATDEDLEMADERSISDFERTLRRLLKEHNYAADRVDLIGWDELAARHAP